MRVNEGSKSKLDTGFDFVICNFIEFRSKINTLKSIDFLKFSNGKSQLHEISNFKGLQFQNHLVESPAVLFVFFVRATAVGNPSFTSLAPLVAELGH